MYSKDELTAKNVAQLKVIAKEIGAKVKSGDNKETIVYAILDAQAEMPAQASTIKRKRARIAKTDDKVYSVSGQEGENYDVMKNQVSGPNKDKSTILSDVEATASKPKARKSAKANDSEEQSIAFPEEANNNATVNSSDNIQKAEVQTNSDQPLPVFPKHRGRKSKAELEAIAAAQAAKLQQTEQDTWHEETAVNESAQNTSDDEQANVPEMQYAAENSDATLDKNLVTELQNKLNNQNEQSSDAVNPVTEDGMSPEGVWLGDPADGTDYIIVEDLPIEDQLATPTYDIFDRPTNDVDTKQDSYTEEAEDEEHATNAKTEEYDFSGIIKANGVLEVMSDGYGFLRSSDYNYLSSPDDIYVPNNIVKRYGLKTGDVVQCFVRPPHQGEKYFPITDIDQINGRNPNEVRDRVPFEHLTPLFPDEKFTLCGDPKTTNMSTRIVDLFSPIGKGQRALIVAQPKTGKTILMKDIANAIAANHPEAYLMMLLIDERPEEVTDMARTVNAEVIASTFDEPAERHVKIAGIVLEKAKRMVECGHDVVIFLDSITRLARAYNTVAPASGKVLTGGVDANALQKPKRFFGAARNIEGGGSLTIIATALIDTGSKMDEVIFEEFKGTGNMELQLDRSLSNKRIFPAVNLVASSTRRDDLLQDQNTINRMWILRKFIADMNPVEAMNSIYNSMQKTKDNDEFLISMNS